MPDQNPPGDRNKIRHTPALGSVPGDPAASSDGLPDTSDPNAPVPIFESSNPLKSGAPLIRAIGEKNRRHEDDWSRTPNTTGAGAIHVKSFHCKLTDDSLRYLDQTINEWLDAHPQYEVKFVTSTVGMLTGKLKEPHLICQVWV
ncbi:MAG: hypothetical protein KC983_03165 [Phycisphaerales bacterium]|nr:hypothetical protein [Phycisphaerales bacterium]